MFCAPPISEPPSKKKITHLRSGSPRAGVEVEFLGLRLTSAPTPTFSGAGAEISSEIYQLPAVSPLRQTFPSRSPNFTQFNVTHYAVFNFWFTLAFDFLLLKIIFTRNFHIKSHK